MLHAQMPFFFDRAWLSGAWRRDVRVIVAAGEIVSIEAGHAAQHGDVRHAIALPGLPNLHSHAFQRGMAGQAELRGSTDDSFWTWREVMYRFLARLTPEDMQAIAALAYAEMLETGFTRVGEFHYVHHDADGAPYADPAGLSAAIAAAAEETGIALTLLPVFYAHAGFGGTAPGAGQRRFINDVDSYARLHAAAAQAIATLPDAVIGIAPHSLRAVTPDELSALLALNPSGPVHIHIAEQVAEVEACLAWSGARPVEWLMAHAPVDPRWCLVHATHMTPAETQALAASGAVAGLCPITEANLGDGLFPAVDYCAAGGRWGVGSDSNVLIDASEELRWLEYGQRLHHRGRNILAPAAGARTGAALLGGALAGGAQALGATAGFAVGAPADFVTLDAAHPALATAPEGTLADAWIFAAGRGAIDGVWRRGRQVVAGGVHLRRRELVDRYGKVVHRLLA